MVCGADRAGGDGCAPAARVRARGCARPRPATPGGGDRERAARQGVPGSDLQDQPPCTDGGIIRDERLRLRVHDDGLEVVHAAHHLARLEPVLRAALESRIRERVDRAEERERPPEVVAGRRPAAERTTLYDIRRRYPVLQCGLPPEAASASVICPPNLMVCLPEMRVNVSNIWNESNGNSRPADVAGNARYDDRPTRYTIACRDTPPAGCPIRRPAARTASPGDAARRWLP